MLAGWRLQQHDVRRGIQGMGGRGLATGAGLAAALRCVSPLATNLRSSLERPSNKRSTRISAADQDWPSQKPPPGSTPSTSGTGTTPQSSPANGDAAWFQKPPGNWEVSMQNTGNLVGGSWQSTDADSDEYYDGSDWGEPYPITDWGEGPWRPNSYSSLEEQSYDSGYGPYPPESPPPPPPSPPTLSPGSMDTEYGTYGSSDPGNGAGGYAFDSAAGSGNDAEYNAGYNAEDASSRRRGSGGEASSSFSGGRPFLSDITLLTREEMEMLMPVPPTRSQTNYYQPRSIQERLVQIASSVGVSLALSKSAVLAAPVLLYPIWSPWVKAGCKNLEVYTKQLRCLGLWRAQVLEVQVFGGSPFSAGSWAFGGRSSRATAPTVRVLIGDGWPSGARVQLEFPYTFRSELLTPGEPVEALVLAKDATFSAFKVIREVYAPGLGLWLSDYPFIDKSAFLDVSLQIESERQAEAERTVDIEAVWEDPGGEPGEQPDRRENGGDRFGAARPSRAGAGAS